MADFNKYAPILKKLEGGWADIPEDKGGATMMGVTLATYRRYYGQDKTKEDLRNITDEEWTYITKTGYWEPWKADEIQNQYIANICVDWGYNSGAKTAIKKVQRLLGLEADGIVGKKTLAALNNPSWRVVFDKIYEARVQFYKDIVTRNPSQKKFYKGWISRISDLRPMG